MKENSISIIIPSCSDFNRGDQALVLETMNIIKKANIATKVYMMSNNETKQCKKFGIDEFAPILKHPSRFDNNSSNIKYGILLKIRWGGIACLDYIKSQIILNNITRKLVKPFLSKKTKKTLELYEKCNSCFVKGGGFLHDYSGGIIGLYTIYYQLYHIKLALKMNKKVYVMPNSFGPFKSNRTAKMVNDVLDKCKVVTARESISASKKSNGLKRDIELYPDLAFFLNQTNQEQIKIYLKDKFNLNFKDNRYVAITVRPYRFYNSDDPEKKYQEYKNSFMKFIKYLENKNYVPLLVVHTRAENDHENDERCIKEISQMLNDDRYIIVDDKNLNCKDLKAVYSCCEYIVGTRFHSVIFSIANKVPAIAITYGGNKGDGIMKDMQLSDYAIKISDLNFEELVFKFENMEKNKKQIQEKIKVFLENAQQKYEKLIEKIMNEQKQGE